MSRQQTRARANRQGVSRHVQQGQASQMTETQAHMRGGHHTHGHAGTRGGNNRDTLNSYENQNLVIDHCVRQSAADRYLPRDAKSSVFKRMPCLPDS